MNSAKIGIINYGMGNLGSVKRKLDNIRTTSFISDNPEELEKADKYILPGVGHFTKAIIQLKNNGLFDYLNENILIKKKPILGICLGMQLMAKWSEEGNSEGFGWIDAIVIKFKIGNKQLYKIPHIGWNNISIKKTSALFNGLNPDQEFYFVHSFHLECNDMNDVLNETVYEYPFVSAIQKDNIIGLQYHPEKSHDAGELLLKNFIKM